MVCQLILGYFMSTNEGIAHIICLYLHFLRVFFAQLYDIKYSYGIQICPLSCGCRIHRLHLCRGVRPSNVCPGYDTKQSDGEAPLMLEHWGMQSTPLLPLLPGPLWPGVVAPD